MINFNRFLCVCYCLFLITQNSFSQESTQKFYIEISPNYTFSKVKTTPEILGAKINSLPMVSFGVGYFQPFKSIFFFDVSLKYHIRNYRSTINAFGVQNNDITGAPFLTANIGAIRSNSTKYKLMAGIGGSLSYMVGSYSLVSFIDTNVAVQKRVDVENEIYKTITSFFNASLGILIPGKKRNYMINVGYSYSFQIPYHAKYTYTEKQNVYFAEVSGRDSFLQLQFKWFLKNRNYKAKQSLPKNFFQE